MKEMLKFYYNVEVDNVIEEKDAYHFFFNDTLFYLLPFKRSIEEFEDIYTVCNELKTRNIPIHTFIRNKEDKIITKMNEINYVLIKIECSSFEELNIIDMINQNNTLSLSKAKSALYRNNWGELWSKKIDYFEYQIRELGKEKKVVLNSFSYYIGMAENAISYANNTEKKHQKTDLERITLSHKRINFPNLKIHFYNPLNFIFDLEVRDIAEYIKSIFFISKSDAFIECKAFLSLRKLSKYGYQMFYARLLYPSYYFDIYEEIMNKNTEEKILIPFIEKSNDYESFLKQIYEEINKYQPIEKIEWLTNKKEL